MKKGWEYKTLKEACIQLFAGGDVPKPYISKTKTKEFSVPIYSNGVENEGLYGYTNSAKIKEQAVTISARGTIGATFRRYEPFFPAIRLITAVPNKEILSIDYLFYALKILTIGNSGTSIPQLTIPNIKNISIPIPPLSEQKEIVEYLDSSFAKIDKLKENAAKNLEEAKALFQSALKDALEPKEGWEEKTMGEICEIIRGKRFVRADIVENGVPCIHYGDLYTHYGLSTTKTKGCINPELAKKMRFANKNDVVVVQAGENKWDIGVGVAYLGEEPAAVHDACFILRHQQNPMYISYYLRSSRYHWYLVDYVHEGKICSFLKPALENAPISLPPLSEQQSIVSFLDSLNEKVNTLQQNYSRICDECDALKQAILRQVFE